MNTSDKSLYERIGGEQSIVQLVDSFYEKVMADDRLAGFFKDTSMDRLKNMQKEFFSLALGGPSKYSDMNLSYAHQGRGIRIFHFRAFVDHLLSTLNELNLSEDERYEIISQINLLVEDITDDSAAPLA